MLASSLRSGFCSRLTGKADSRLIDFFMGQAIGTEKRAYLNLPPDELRELYANLEHLLAIEKTSRDELGDRKEGKTTSELQAKIAALETTTKGLTETVELQKIEPKRLTERMLYTNLFNIYQLAS